jgi:hypothetical protein
MAVFGPKNRKKAAATPREQALEGVAAKAGSKIPDF